MTEIQDYGMGDFNTLYHYTSADGLKSIIENKTSWNYNGPLSRLLY